MSHDWPIYTLVSQVDPKPVEPVYRILETDPRTRVCDGVWSDSVDAMTQRLDDLRKRK
jgi:hypothetical protein